MANETRLGNNAQQTRLDQSSGVSESAQASVTRLESGVGSTQVTQLDTGVHRQPVDGIRVVVPQSLRNRFHIHKQLPTQGAEADILVAEDNEHGRQVIIKLYRHGIEPKSEVLARISSMAAEHVVQLYEHGKTEDGVWYEIMEYAKYGSLRDLIKKPVPPEQAKAILQELHAALGELHQHQIIHRDLKPENILVRELWPLDLVLTDFGIASINVATQHMTNTSRTAKYAAPEAASGVISPKADWWSLGMIMLEVLLGKTPFDGMSDAVITKHLINHPVRIDGVSDARWTNLLRGLLNRNDEVRWGQNEIGRWLDGEDVAAAMDTDQHFGSETTAKPAYRPYSFAGVSYDKPQALASGLVQHWDEGVKHLARDLILQWFRDEIKDQDAISFLLDLKENRELSADVKLLRLIQRLDPDLPPIWKGIDVSVDGLQAIAQTALSNGKQRQWLWEFRTIGLPEYSHNHLRAVLATLNEWENDIEIGWERLKNAWIKCDRLPEMQMPIRPENAYWLPELILAAFNEQRSKGYQGNLREHQFEDAQQCPWFVELDGENEKDVPTLLLKLAVVGEAVNWVVAKRNEEIRVKKEKWELENSQVLFEKCLSELNELPKWRSITEGKNIISKNSVLFVFICTTFFYPESWSTYYLRDGFGIYFFIFRNTLIFLLLLSGDDVTAIFFGRERNIAKVFIESVILLPILISSWALDVTTHNYSLVFIFLVTACFCLADIYLRSFHIKFLKEHIKAPNLVISGDFYTWLWSDKNLIEKVTSYLGDFGCEKEIIEMYNIKLDEAIKLNNFIK